MIGKSEAIELARRECERRGIAWEEPVSVVHGLFVVSVWTHTDKIGGNVIVTLGRRRGEVRNVSITPK
jgi:hypothetical protein